MSALSFTFEVEDGHHWQHRGPETWLSDLFRAAGLDMVTTDVSSEWGRGREGGSLWLVTVTGDEPALRLALVALNLHGEQDPWDTTPTVQAEALDEYLAHSS